MTRTVPLLFLAMSLVSCAYPGPAISKSDIGNLQVNVYGPQDAPG